ncbi:Uncharacterized protein Rs2_21414 [Raphanus sativus]|nr:Uncharacterized protein Rs2_21414 [Raphanus sativus]
MYEVDDFPSDYSYWSWENDYYQPTFAVEAAETRDDEYDEDYVREREIEYSFPRREEEPTPHVSHPFIPADHDIIDSYSEPYGKDTSLNRISRAEKGKSIDINNYTSIDMGHTEERDDFPGHYYLIFALETASSSQHLEEYSGNYEKEQAKEHQGVLIGERFPSHSHGIINSASTDVGHSTSIDTSPRRGEHAHALIDTVNNKSIDMRKPTLRKMKFQNWKIGW